MPEDERQRVRYDTVSEVLNMQAIRDKNGGHQNLSFPKQVVCWLLIPMTEPIRPADRLTQTGFC